MEKEKDDKKIINIDLDDDEDESRNNYDVNDSNSENSTAQFETGSGNKTSKKNIKLYKALKELKNNSTKFMSNFDPELSNREKRKLTRKIIAEGKKNGSAHDDSGALGSSEKDTCDCLNDNCPGCHFPCPKCRSCKCGVECRVNRKWTYDLIENEAEVTSAKNCSITAG